MPTMRVQKTISNRPKVRTPVRTKRKQAESVVKRVRAKRGTSVAIPKNVKYKQLLDMATTPGNELLLFKNGSGLITTPTAKQGIWVSRTIIALWQAEGYI